MLANLTTWLIDPSGLTPHGFCLLWEPGLIWLHALSDIAIAIAYFTIPLALAIFARRRRDLVFKPVFWLFATFILLCGTTHWLGVLTLFVPAYGLEGVVKAVTAIVSIVTAAALWPLLPKALALPSAAQLQEANAALQASEARYRGNFEHSPVPMQVLDPDFRIAAVSDSWLQMLGYTREQVIGRLVRDFQAPDSVSRAAEEYAHLLATGEVRNAERRFLRKDHTSVETLVSARLEQNGADCWLICTVVDISARRHAEAALRASEECLHQAQKMEAVGQLTGGIAHDFNNMLQVMSGGLEMLERHIDEGDPERLADYLRLVRESLDRATGLTQRMLAFARRQSLQPRPIGVDALVTSLEELIRRTVGPSIAVRLELQEGPWPTLCDPNQLESALLNLAINARDAMPDGGTLRIATANHRVTAAELAENDGGGSAGTEPGDYVEITVADDGTGMPAEVKARVFEPFFTTKPIGQGTGLGLSQLYGFVRQSGGLLRLDSEPGQGTTLRLLLPRSQEAAASDAPRAGTTEPDHAALNPGAHDFGGHDFGGNDLGTDDLGIQCATVLVVDDEPAVRILVVEMLRDMDLEVIEAADATDALQLVEAGPRIDLLVTDVGLPGLNGRQLADLVRQRHPDLPVLLITGYAGGAVDQAVLPPGIELIHKPFTLDAIGSHVRAALQFARVA